MQSDNVPMQMEGIKIAHKDIERLHILKMVLECKMTLVEAAVVLQVSYRHAERLKKAAAEGIKGIVHGNRGRVPTNKTQEALRARVVALAEGKYSNFNDTLCADAYRAGGDKAVAGDGAQDTQARGDQAQAEAEGKKASCEAAEEAG
ncbi:MAG: helix-turn-helix domain-containing protein [Armatimonadetes bacterium]|nr:helix-turn-helix domain-containing protein [Armatimonadota bacterium]